MPDIAAVTSPLEEEHQAVQRAASSLHAAFGHRLPARHCEQPGLGIISEPCEGMGGGAWGLVGSAQQISINLFRVRLS